MIRKHPILSSLAGLFLALALTAWGLDKSGVFVRALKPQVISALSQATGRRVKVASIEGGLFGSIVLKDLSLSFADKPAAFDAAVEVQKASVRFSLWDFFIMKKDAMESLRSLDLEGPDISLRILPLPSASPAPAKIDVNQLLATLPLPPISTSVSDGRVTLSLSTEGKGELVFEGLDARLSTDRKASVARLSLGGRAYGGRLGIKGRFRPADASLSASLDLKGLDLARLSRAVWVPEAVPALDEGRADGSFNLSVAKGFDAKGGLHVSGVRLQLPKAGEVSALQADLSLDGRKLVLERLRFKSQEATWQGRGEVADLGSPEIQLHVGSVEGRPAYRGLSVEHALIAMRASKSSLILEGLTLSSQNGTLSASGAAEFLSSGATALDFAARAESFPLPALAALASGELKLSGDSLEPLMTASLRMPVATLKGEVFEGLSLALESRGPQAKAVLSGGWRGFKELKLSASGSPEKFGFKLQHAADAWLKGNAQIENEKICLKASIEGIEAATVLEALKQKLNLSGPIQGSIELRGALKDPDFFAHLDGKGMSLPAEADLKVKGGAFRLESLMVRSGEITASGGGGEFELHFTRASLAALAALSARMQGRLSGSLDGSLTLKKKDEGWVAAPRLSGSDLSAWGQKLKTFRAEGEATENRWKLSRLDAVQENGGALSLSGEYDPQGQGVVAILLDAQRWSFGSRDFSFHADARGSRPGAMARIFKRVSGAEGSGGGQIEGSLAVTGMAAQVKALPDLTADWKWRSGKELKLGKLAWGKGISGGGSWDAELGWKAALSAKGAEWRQVATAAGLERDAVKSPLNAEFSAEGKGATGECRLALGSNAQARLAWAPDAGGRTRLSGGAEFNDFEVSRALELASLWAGMDFRESTRDFSGRLSASLGLEGTAPFSVSFTAKVPKLKQGGDVWGQLSLQGQLKDGALVLQKAEAGDSHSNLALSDLRLARAPDGRLEIKSRFEAQGFPDFAFMKAGGAGEILMHAGKGGGDLELSWSRLRLNRQDFDKGGARASWTADSIEAGELSAAPRWKAQTHKEKEGGWKIDSIHAVLDKGGILDAKDGMDEEGNARLETSGTAVEASLIARMLDWKIDLKGLVFGNGVFRMPKGANGYLYMLLSAKVENGALEGFPFDLATGTVRLEDGTLTVVEQGHIMRRSRYDAAVTGLVPIYRNDDKPLADMSLKADIKSADLGLIDYLDAIDSASGTVTAELSITGKALYPDYNGKAEVSGGAIKFKRLLAPATDLQGQIFLDKNRLDILKLDAQMGGTGQRIYIEKGPGEGPAVLFDQWLCSKLNIRLRSGKSGIRAEGNPGYTFMTGTLVPDLVLDGSWDDPSFRGTLALREATIIWPPLRKAPAGPDDPKSFSSRLNWDMLGQVGENVVFRSFQDVKITEAETVRATITTDQNKGVRVRGPGEALMLSGRVKPIRGRLSFLSADFNLDPDKNGMVEFRQDQPPYLDIYGYRDVGSTRVLLNARGELGKIDVTLSRDGAIGQSSDDRAAEQAELASLVGFGTTDPNKIAGRALGKSLTWLGKSVISGAGKEIGRQIGMSSPVDFSVQGSVLDRLASTSTTAANSVSANADNLELNIGKQIFPKVYVKAGIGSKGDNKGGSETYGTTGVEVDVGKGQKIELVGGVNDESRAQYRAQQNFDNYDPRKRREELRRKREMRGQTPTPSPSPSPRPENP